MEHITLQVIEKQHTTHLYIGKNLFANSSLWQQIIDNSSSIVLITDSNVYRCYTNFIHKLVQVTSHIFVYILPSGESLKSRHVKEKLEDELFQRHIDRYTSIVAFGGGTITDLAGFLASTYLRGVQLHLIPTSLLSMIDASIGGKTAINTSLGKNLLGTFYFPKTVYIDIWFLKTLSSQELISGFAEIIKYGCIYDATLFELLEKNIPNWEEESIDSLLLIIKRSVEIKQNIVQLDLYDQGIRHILNFGHTLAHAIEVCEKYTISHGQAVAIGILGEAYLSYHMKRLSYSDFMRIYSLIKNYSFDLRISSHISSSDILAATLRDKKTISSVPHCVLLTAIGTVSNHPSYLHLVDEVYWSQVIHWLISNFSDRTHEKTTN
ncbi:MAG: 3-dehydroquinate synthase [Chlamydiales bacterium]